MSFPVTVTFTNNTQATLPLSKLLKQAKRPEYLLNVKSLNLSNAQFKGAQFYYLCARFCGTSTALESISLDNCFLKRKDVKTLQHALFHNARNTLKIIHWDNNFSYDTAGHWVRILSESKIEVLSLTNTNLSREDGQKLSEEITKRRRIVATGGFVMMGYLKELHLDNNPDISPEDIQMIDKALTKQPYHQRDRETQVPNPSIVDRFFDAPRLFTPHSESKTWVQIEIRRHMVAIEKKYPSNSGTGRYYNELLEKYRTQGLNAEEQEKFLIEMQELLKAPSDPTLVL